jgi:microcystin-dependent protein
MSYTINFTDAPNNPGGITVEDQSINENKSIKFIGKNYTGYAKVIAENFLHLLENFAKAEAPNNPVIGQLWYDTDSNNDPSQPQLLVYDGTNWQPAGTVKKKSSQPLASESVIGDLWVDTANQQLYLWSGSSWILIGPEFSAGTVTGPKVESLVDTLNSEQFVISLYVGDERIAIVSSQEFTPKLSVDGFSKIKKGINLRDTNDSGVTNIGNSAFRFVGSATNSEKLGGIESANFVRNDINSTTNGSFSIRNNAGLILGSDLSVSLSNTNTGATVLYNKTEGSSIFIRTNQDGAAQDAITITGANVGINKTNPVYELDVSGTVRASNNLFVTGTNNAVDLNTGSIRTAGGLSVQKSLHVGQGITVTGTLTGNNIVPDTTGIYDIGTEDTTFRNIYASKVISSNFEGSFSGQLIGSVTGSASRLASSTNFRLIGEVTSNTVSFNGLQSGGVAEFTSTVSSDFISNKLLVNSVNNDDLLLIQRPATGLQKVTVSGLFSKAGVLPIGALMPFAGSVAPNGFVLCDGSEYLISEYTELWQVIGYTYKPLGLLQGLNTFAVPDLRGRFPLGLDNMFSDTKVPKNDGSGDLIYTIGSNASRVNATAANTIGSGSGAQDTQLQTNQLPEHTHDMRGLTSTGEKGQQYYAFRNSSDPGGDVNTVSHTTNGPSLPNEGQYLPNSGGVNSSILGAAVSLMNPYISLNYIIYTGKYF